MPVAASAASPDDSRDGQPGPLTAKLQDQYWRRHEDPRFSTPVRYDEHG